MLYPIIAATIMPVPMCQITGLPAKNRMALAKLGVLSTAVARDASGTRSTKATAKIRPLAPSI